MLQREGIHGGAAGPWRVQRMNCYRVSGVATGPIRGQAVAGGDCDARDLQPALSSEGAVRKLATEGHLGGQLPCQPVLLPATFVSACFNASAAEPTGKQPAS